MREPSLGPCFGIKGGAAGGGYAQVVPCLLYTSVPDDYELVCFLPIGIPKEKNIIKTKKKSFDERAWFNGFKNSK